LDALLFERRQGDEFGLILDFGRGLGGFRLLGLGGGLGCRLDNRLGLRGGLRFRRRLRCGRLDALAPHDLLVLGRHLDADIQLWSSQTMLLLRVPALRPRSAHSVARRADGLAPPAAMPADAPTGSAASPRYGPACSARTGAVRPRLACVSPRPGPALARRPATGP